MKSKIVMLSMLGVYCIFWFGVFLGISSEREAQANTLKERVYAYFGQGDKGEEVNYYLQTGDTTFAVEWGEEPKDAVFSTPIDMYMERNFIQDTVDERGLRSVKIVEQYEDCSVETLAWDYLTPIEYKTLKEHSIKF